MEIINGISVFKKHIATEPNGLSPSSNDNSEVLMLEVIEQTTLGKRTALS